MIEMVNEKTTSHSKKKELEFSGERFHPEVAGQIAYEHFHRYSYATEYVKDKIVLDIASGEGYGSAIISLKAKHVCGVDVSEEAVNHAIQKYGHIKNLNFRKGDCKNIPAEANEFDIVVSFETLEHIKEQIDFFAEIKRVLKEDGLLVISTPNRKIYSEERDYNNPFHVSELNEDEFFSLIKTQFSFVELWGQRLTFSSTIWPINLTGNFYFKHYHNCQSLDASVIPPFEPEYFIAVCSNSQFIPRNNLSLFTNHENELYKDYENRGKWASELNNDNKNLEKRIVELHEELKALNNYKEREIQLNDSLSQLGIMLNSDNLFSAEILINRLIKIFPEYQVIQKLIKFVETRRNKLIELNKYNTDVGNKLLESITERINNGNYEEIIDKAQFMLNLEPRNLNALINMSAIYMLKKDFNNARKIIELIFEIDPNNEITKNNLKYLNENLDE